MKWIATALLLGALGVTSGCGSGETGGASGGSASGGPTQVESSSFKSGDGGLKYAVLKPGSGKEAKDGSAVKVHYTGWLESNGSKFDSSVDSGKPFDFTLGRGEVIAGWDQGVSGMKVGEKRQLVIPSTLGYGQQGSGPIPGGATLVFDVELLEVADAAADPHAGHNHGPGDGHNH